MSTVFAERPEKINIPDGTPETLANTPGSTITDEPRTTIKVPSCRPTPLIGSWADESWPLNSRQASEIITEQVLTKQRSSIVFEDENGNVTFGEATVFQPSLHQRSPSSLDDEETVNESLMQEAMSHAQISSEEVQSCAHTDAESPTHIAQSFMFNPYDIHESRTVLARCTCELCVSVLLQNGPSVGSHLAVDEADEEEEVIMVQHGMMEISEFDSVSHHVTPAALQTVDQFSTDYPVYDQDQGHHDDWDLPTYNHKVSPSLAQAPMGHHMPQQDNSSAAPFPGGNKSGFMTHTQISSPPFMEQTTPQPSPGQMNATPGSNVSGLSHPPPTQRRVIPEAERPQPEPREISKFMPDRKSVV